MAQAHDLYALDKKTPIGRRLQKLTKAWQKKQEAPLAHRQKLLSLWASGFFDNKYEREHLINLIDRGVFTIVPYLVEGNPRMMVETKVANYRPWAYTTQLALNFLIEDMCLADRVFIPLAINSMFGMGIARTFSEYNRIITLDDEELIKVGSPQIRVIDDADYIGDCAAKTRDDYLFEGDIYKLPTSYARELFSDHADSIMADCKLTNDYHPEKISNGEWDINRLSLRDYTTFMDIYLYDEGVTVTIMPDGKSSKILRTVEEDGPDGTPYDVLGYKYFPGSTTPIPPAWAWHDLDVSMNILARTAREQAESQKDLIFVDPGDEDLRKTVTSARNLDVIPMMGAKDGVNKISLGGVNPDNYNWMQFAEGEFSKAGATPPSMRGEGASAPTLGQEQLIHANASRIVNNMHTRWGTFMNSIIRKLAYRVWTSPTTYVPVIDQIPGVGDMPAVFSKADQVGEFYDFVFSLVPYSAQRTSPEIQGQKLMAFMSQWVLPTYQFAAQQGAQLDIPTVTRILSDYMGFENFNQWYHTAIPHELSGVSYQMQPDKKRPNGADQFTKSPGQMNDSSGANDFSRLANMNQQQERTNNEAT